TRSRSRRLRPSHSVLREPRMRNMRFGSLTLVGVVVGHQHNAMTLRGVPTPEQGGFDDVETSTVGRLARASLTVVLLLGRDVAEGVELVADLADQAVVVLVVAQLDPAEPVP